MSQPLHEPCALLRRRSTLPLTGTTAKTQASLDFRSYLATEYAQAWLAAAGSPKVPLSGLMRRALTLYMQHLAKDTTEARAELMAVRLACSARQPDEADQQAALGRLQGIQAGQPFPTYSEVLDGPGAASRRAAEEEAYGRLADAAMATPQGRFATRRPTPTEAPTDIQPASENTPHA